MAQRVLVGPFRPRQRGLVPLVACLALACSKSEAEPPTSCSNLQFLPVLAEAEHEGYVCFAFAVDQSQGSLASLTWDLTSHGGVGLHHAALYTTAEERPLSVPFSCDPMPVDALAVHVGVPGSEVFSLPPNMGLELSRKARTLIVEAHAYRTDGNAAGQASVSLCSAAGAPATLAGRFAVGAPVPAIRPHTVEVSTALCRVPADVRLLYSWPHMHRSGREFHAALLRDEQRLPLLELSNWDFTHQVTYETGVDARAGDLIETACVWENDSDEYVLPGLLSANEMCTHGVTAYPADRAYCDPQ
jgi:hypothetical protein